MKQSNPIDRAVGKQLHDKRTEKEISLEHLASRLGISATELRGFECGDIRIDSRVMLKMCNLLNVRPAYFFEPILAKNSGADHSASTASSTVVEMRKSA